MMPTSIEMKYVRLYFKILSLLPRVDEQPGRDNMSAGIVRLCLGNAEIPFPHIQPGLTIPFRPQIQAPQCRCKINYLNHD